MALACGCGYSTYVVAPAELQRLAQLPPALRGDHVRVFTPGLVPVAAPNPPVVTAPPTPPPPQQPAPPPDAVVNGEVVADPGPAEVIYGPESEPPEPAVVVAVNVAPPAQPLRARPAPARLPPPPAGRPSAPPPSLGPVAPPPPHSPAIPGRGSAPAVHSPGGHFHPVGLSTSHHSSGGGGAAVGALAAAVVLVGLVAVIADASEPEPFDGWIRTSPEHTVQLTYASGATRDVRLRDLKLADTIGVRSAVLYSTGGSVERLEIAASIPPAVQPARPASPPPHASAPRPPPIRPGPATPQSAPPSAPTYVGPSDPFL